MQEPVAVTIIPRACPASPRAPKCSSSCVNAVTCRSGRMRSCRQKRAAPGSKHQRERSTLVVYSFVLHAPPVALEQVEGALEAQRALLQSARDAEVIDGTVMMQAMALENVVRLAIDGDRDALDRLVRDLQGDVYGLALRMPGGAGADSRAERVRGLGHRGVHVRSRGGRLPGSDAPPLSSAQVLGPRGSTWISRRFFIAFRQSS